MIEYNTRIILVTGFSLVLAMAVLALAVSSAGTGASTNMVLSKASNVAVTASSKHLYAFVLQYVDLNSQISIYKPILGNGDMVQLRENNASLVPSYVSAVLGLPGGHGATYTSSADIIANAPAERKLGFDDMELNIESGLSPASDTANVVLAVQAAAKASHSAGLKFRVDPSMEYTTEYGPQIALVSDYYHIQAQSLQDTCGTGHDAFKAYVDSEVPILRKANPGLIITVQESASQNAAPGKTIVQTMESCFSEVASKVNGTSVWFGNPTLSDLQYFVDWFHSRYGVVRY